MQQLVSSQTMTSTTVACRVYFTTSCTGLTSPSESSTGWLLCLEDKAPMYLSDHCIPVTAVSSWHLRLANQQQLTVPCCWRITFGHWVFSVAGPMVWNSLLIEFRDLSVGFGIFRRTLKTVLFARYYCIQRKRCMHDIALYKFPISIYLYYHANSVVQYQHSLHTELHKFYKELWW